MRHWMFTILVFFAVDALAAPTQSPYWLMEAAPLQGAMGQLALRFEKKWQEKFGLGLGIEQKSYFGDRSDRKNLSYRLRAELVGKAQIDSLPGMFWFAGFALEYAKIARRQERDYLTNIKYTEDERWDRWENEDVYASLPLGIGYRWQLGAFVTTAIRFEHDTLLYRTSRNHAEEIYSPSVDMTTQARSAHIQHLIFYAGISFD